MSNGTPFTFTRYHATTLSDFFNTIDIISDKMKNYYINQYKYKNTDDICPQLWFRGHGNADYVLLPTLLRGSGDVETKDSNNLRYTVTDLQEDYYFHSFSGRAGHQVDSGVNTRTSWSEVMQHHSLPTRMLDWSLDAMSALTFALGELLNPQNKGATATNPVIFVQCPFFINLEVYKKITSIELIDNALSDIENNKRNRKILGQRLYKAMIDTKLVDFHSVIENINRGLCSDSTNMQTVDGIVSLSAIANTFNIDANRLKNMLYNIEINPFFYLIYRYYIDAIPISPIKLPPLSVVHRYHSKRIEAQNGTFSIFPSYSIQHDDVMMKKLGIDRRCMEYYPQIQNFIFSIQIDNPYVVAREIYMSGGRYSSVYPEVERYAQEITFTTHLF